MSDLDSIKRLREEYKKQKGLTRLDHVGYILWLENKFLRATEPQTYKATTNNATPE